MGTNLGFALTEAWNDTGRLLLDEEGSPQPASRVRAYLRELLDGQPKTNLAARKFWEPLTPAQKDEALNSTFPDGTDYAYPDEPDDE